MNEGGLIFVLGSFVAAITLRVTRMPVAGETVRAEDFRIEPGGKGFNVAVAARRLGAPVDGLIAAGSDHFADMAADALVRAGLPETMLLRFLGHTGAGMGLIDRNGENLIAVFPGANDLLSAENVAAARERLARAGCVVAQFEIADDPISAAFAQARANGARTILNPSPYRPIGDAILSATDVLVVNAVECASLLRDLCADGCDATGEEALVRSLAAQVFARGVGALVVTLGPEGAVLWRRDAEPFRQPAYRIQPVDTIGAGDAFLAGLAVGLSEGAGWPESLRLASACGAITALGAGVLDALPGREQVRDFLSARSAAP